MLGLDGGSGTKEGSAGDGLDDFSDADDDSDEEMDVEEEEEEMESRPAKTLNRFTALDCDADD